jgi:Glycosyl hydrolase family 48/Cellulose binding domain/Bacterial Ig domain
MIRSRRRRTALVTLATVAVATFVAGPATPAQAQGVVCDVDYAKAWEGGTGFGANVTIRNLGTTAINGWELQFSFAGNQQVTNGWIAQWSQDGQDVTAVNESWSALIPAGGSLALGFNGSVNGPNEDPDTFFLNGVQCGGTQQNQPPTADITSPPNGATFTAPADIAVNATATDPDGTVSRVDFFINGNLAGSDSSSPYSFTHNDVPAGSYALVARAVDNLNATGDDQINVVVNPSNQPTILTTLNTVNFTEGGTGTYGVRLSQQPTANVQVSTSRTSGNTGITVQSGAALTFTPQNWNTNQTVTLVAADGTGGQSAVFTSTATGWTPAAVTANSLNQTGQVDPLWVDRFMEEYDKIKNSGYFSSNGLPYHSIETLIVEAPDYGHVTTSEAFSYWLWMEANYGRITEDWGPFNQAWQTMETAIIPGQDDFPGAGGAGDAIYAAEHPLPSGYPSQLDQGVPVGQDPLRGELQSTYGTPQIYGMHWLLDVDNDYGYGHCGNGTTAPSYINTFQRGPQESTWETIPHPSCETFEWGGDIGFLDLFVGDPGGGATQSRYTNAPDADARAIQAAYWAQTWATEQGNAGDVAATIDDAARMGDYLRYAMFDKYFKQIGNCVGPTTCPAGSGKNSAHYLMSWYYAFGGSYPNSEWSWRIGSSHNHFGYQNPVAAWALSTVPEFIPNSPSAQTDWATSLDRQMEFYQWLQSAEGGIAGGATNSWGGAYGTPPAGTPTFYGMFYEDCPVYHDPCSNEWFGFQVWSMQRVAEYLFLTDDPTARALMDNWVPWAMGETTVGTGGDFEVPSEMAWTGAPATWNPNNPQPNNNLHVQVTSHGQDVGVTAAYARTLMWYAAATGDTASQEMALDLLEALYANMTDTGITTVETREDYDRFLDPVFVPPGWTGVMGNGEQIQSGVTFYDIRESIYENDPRIDEVLAYANGTGPAPTFEYHRSWAQMDIANAFADYAHLFPSG